MALEERHSRIGASSAKRWMNCTASIDLCATVPSIDSKYASEGTKAHDIAEKYLKGQKVPYGEMRDNAKIYSDVIMTVYINAVTPGPIHYESKVELSLLSRNSKYKAFGTVDAWFYDYGTNILYVFDYKYGAGELVLVDKNEQMFYYASAIVDTLGKWLECKGAQIHIIQPRMDNVASDYVTIDEMNGFVFGAIEVLKAPKVFKDGAHCRWCDAKFICPVKIAKINELVGADIQQKLNRYMLRSPNDMTETEILNALQNADLLSSWISSVRNYATSFVQMGGTIPGYSLQETVGNRQYMDESVVIEAFADLPEDTLYTKKLKTPAQLEKVLPKARKKTLESLTSREVTGVKLKYTEQNDNNVKEHLFKSFNNNEI